MILIVTVISLALSFSKRCDLYRLIPWSVFRKAARFDFIHLAPVDDLPGPERGRGSEAGEEVSLILRCINNAALTGLWRGF